MSITRNQAETIVAALKLAQRLEHRRAACFEYRMLERCLTAALARKPLEKA
jgi:hypothetical protein